MGQKYRKRMNCATFFGIFFGILQKNCIFALKYYNCTRKRGLTIDIDMKRFLHNLMICSMLLTMSMTMSSCLTTMGLMLIWLDDDEPQQQQEMPVEKIYSDFKYEVTSMKKGNLDGDFINKLTMKGNGSGIQYTSSDPSVASVDPSGRVDILTTGTTTITATIEDHDNYIYNQHTASYTILVVEGFTYVQYNTTSKEFETVVLSTDDDYVAFPAPPASGDVTLNDTKPYIVKESVTVNGDLVLGANTKIVLVDGFTLKVNGAVRGTSHTLTVYGQTWQNSIGLLDVKASSYEAIQASSIYLHSTYVLAEATGSQRKGFYVHDNFGIYGSIVQGQGGPGANGHGIYVDDSGDHTCQLNIVSSLVSGIGGNNSEGNGGSGIFYAGSADLVVAGNTIVSAQGGNVSGGYDDQAGDGLKLLDYPNIVLDGGTLYLHGGRNTKRSANFSGSDRFTKDGHGLYLRDKDNSTEGRRYIVYKGGYMLVEYDNHSKEGGEVFNARMSNESGENVSFYDNNTKYNLNKGSKSQTWNTPYVKMPAEW